MGDGRRARLLSMLAAGVALLGAASCGDNGPGAAVGKRDGGGAGRGGAAGGHDGGGGAGPDAGATDAARCPTPRTLAAEPPLPQVAFDGGVPLDQYVHALSVARCSYWSRCFALSAYVADQCVDQLVDNDNTFAYPPSGVSERLFDPSDALVPAAAAGVVRYDPLKESQCLAAELAEGCAYNDLVENLPACVGVFTCPPGPDGGTGPTDAGAVDGGASCRQLVAGYDQPLRTCTTDDDCAGVDAGRQGPVCVGGLCAQTRCGLFPIAGCTSLAAAGAPCRTNAFSVLNAQVDPAASCAPGLGCQGATRDGGLGTCVVPVDVGGPCTDDVNCKPGLACACGTCEIPPASGPCVNGLCQVGVSYCDRATGTCHPVRQLDASCRGAPDSCAIGLTCDPGLLICQPPS